MTGRQRGLGTSREGEPFSRRSERRGAGRGQNKGLALEGCSLGLDSQVGRAVVEESWDWWRPGVGGPGTGAKGIGSRVLIGDLEVMSPAGEWKTPRHVMFTVGTGEWFYYKGVGGTPALVYMNKLCPEAGFVLDAVKLYSFLQAGKREMETGVPVVPWPAAEGAPGCVSYYKHLSMPRLTAAFRHT